MLRKQIGYFISVSLKFFFDFDYAFSSHALLFVVLAAGLAKLFFKRIQNELHEGALTVKQDYLVFRDQVMTAKERWDKSKMSETLLLNIRKFRNNISETDIWNRWTT